MAGSKYNFARANFNEIVPYGKNEEGRNYYPPLNTFNRARRLRLSY
jgi:hypothetical protein